MRTLVRIPLAVLAGVLACGLPLWPIPYSQVSMPGNPDPMTWLFLGTLAGVFAAFLLRPGFIEPVLAIAAGFVLAVLVRVAHEIAADPTSHNLWPFEVIVAGFFGVFAGVIGTILARGAQRAVSTRRSG